MGRLSAMSYAECCSSPRTPTTVRLSEHMEEVLGLLRECEWFKVYDVAEALWRALEHDFGGQQLFQDELNRFFREKGIGWELKDPDGIVFRGREAFAARTTEAAEILAQTGRIAAASEVRDAMRDMSRRPVPDRTAAIQQRNGRTRMHS
jgi:hypothetical protein